MYLYKTLLSLFLITSMHDSIYKDWYIVNLEHSLNTKVEFGASHHVCLVILILYIKNLTVHHLLFSSQLLSEDLFNLSYFNRIKNVGENVQ